MSLRLTIANVQLCPRLGKVNDNASRASALVAQAFAGSTPDLVILPELALTGYNFPGPDAIEPFLEPLSVARPAASLSWAMATSLKYNCFTLIGYPEKCESRTYNSAVLVSPAGTIIHNYRKSFLYETDSVWGCLEGPAGFETFALNLNKTAYGSQPQRGPDEVVQTTVGICMDLNPYRFEAPFNKFEFASHAFASDATLLLCPMAWLSARSPSLSTELSVAERVAQGEAHARLHPVAVERPAIDGPNTARTWDYTDDAPGPYLPEAPDCTTVNYWILRFFPFLNHSMKRARPDLTNTKTRTVVLCNRSGIETDVLYGGSSSIIQFNGKSCNTPGDFDSLNAQNDSVAVLGSLGQGEEGVLIREVVL